MWWASPGSSSRKQRTMVHENSLLQLNSSWLCQTSCWKLGEAPPPFRGKVKDTRGKVSKDRQRLFVKTGPKMIQNVTIMTRCQSALDAPSLLLRQSACPPSWFCSRVILAFHEVQNGNSEIHMNWLIWRFSAKFGEISAVPYIKGSFYSVLLPQLEKQLAETERVKDRTIWFVYDRSEVSLYILEMMLSDNHAKGLPWNFLNLCVPRCFEVPCERTWKPNWRQGRSMGPRSATSKNHPSEGNNPYKDFKNFKEWTVAQGLW